jgi:predicted nucleic acid-binding protein
VSVLVDTSVWSLALRRKPEQLSPPESALVTELTELVNEGRARLIGPVRQELLSGIKSVQQYEKLRAELRAFTDEPIATSDYELAARTNNDCKARGFSVSAIDALICAIALSHRLSIFTTDADFFQLKKILAIKLHAART